jgi:hypothetical protein
MWEWVYLVQSGWQAPVSPPPSQSQLEALEVMTVGGEGR